MKKSIHPEYIEKAFICSCGNKISIGTTYSKGKEAHVSVCSACHQFYTKQKRTVAKGGRVEIFKQRFAKKSK